MRCNQEEQTKTVNDWAITWLTKVSTPPETANPQSPLTPYCTDRFHYNPEGYSNGAHHEHDHHDRDMAESGRYESINANNYLHQSPGYFTGEHLGTNVEMEDFASEAADELSPPSEENFSQMERCSGLGRCPAHMWSESISF